MITTSFRIVSQIKCNCSAYQYPHSVGFGVCCERVTSKPPYKHPRRGTASKLVKLIQIYQSVESEEVQNFLSDLKQLLNISE